MVSKLEILARYYQIHLPNLPSMYFEYEQKKYFLASHAMQEGIEEHYFTYCQYYQLPMYLLVPNCFGQAFSEGCQLYQLQSIGYYDCSIVYTNLYTVKNKKILKEDLVESWSRQIDEVRSSIRHYGAKLNLNEYYVIVAYYYVALAENAIQLLQLIPSIEFECSISHRYVTSSVEYCSNPFQLQITNRVQDIVNGYKQGIISVGQIHLFIQQYKLSFNEITLLYATSCFPHGFFDYCLDNKDDGMLVKKKMIEYYHNLTSQKQKLLILHKELQQYGPLPLIPWLDKT